MNPRGGKRSLTTEQVVDAALGIIDARGLDALTMRRLGTVLGVDPMTLYRHVENKEHLLDLTVDRMRSEMSLESPMPEDPAEFLVAVFGEYRRVLASHPNMLPLASRRTGGAATSGLQYLIDRGLGVDAAVELYQSLVAYTIGFALLGSGTVDQRWKGFDEETSDRLRSWGSDTFTRTLRLIVDGYGLGEEEGR